MRLVDVSRLLLLLPALAVTACGVSNEAPGAVHPAGIGGAVHGGQQPVSGATIQLYSVGATGDGSAATPLLLTAVTTDSGGNFNITGKYTCLNATQVYLLASGGNPGLSQANPSLALMAALGPCSSLSPATFISVNELTTVAAVSSLAPYMTGPAAVGSGTSDASSLASAFAQAGEYVDNATGISPGNNVPAGDTVPTALINTLGDIVATCVNSPGGTAGDGSACGQLFSLTTPAGASAPANTIAALLALAKNPLLNTQALFNLASGIAPFVPTLTVAPPDFRVRFNTPASQQVLQLSASSLTFPATLTTFSATAQAVTFTNSSTSTVTLGALSVIGTAASDFAQTSNCGASLVAGAACTASLTFTPQAVGTRAAYLAIPSSTPDSPQYVPLYGTGVAGAPHATFSAPILNYSVGGSTQDVTLTNTGTAPLSMTGFTTITPYFYITTTCGASLAVNASCVISVLDQAPAQDALVTKEQVYPDLLSLASNDPSPNNGVYLIADNVSSVAPGILDFAGVPVGSSSSLSLNVALYTPINYLCPTLPSSSSAFSFGAPASSTVYLNSGPFFLYCAYPVMFSPTATGRQTYKFSLNPLFGPTTSYVTFSGTGVSALLSPIQLVSGSSGQISVQNQSSSAINIQSITVPAGFSQTNTCGSSIAAQSQCSVTVASSITAASGGVDGSLTLTDDAGTQLAQVTSPAVATLDFGAAQVGGTGYTTYSETVTSSSFGSAGASFTGTGDFSGTSCNAIKGASCTATGKFTPSAAGLRTGTMTVGANGTNNGAGTSTVYAAQGRGIAPGVSLTFAVPPLSTTPFAVATNFSIALYNTGTTNLTLTSATMSGANASEFSPSLHCAATIAPATSCSVTLAVTATEYGLRTATLSITDSTSGQVFSQAFSFLSTYAPPSASQSPIPSFLAHINATSAPVAETITRPNADPVTIALVSGQFTIDKTSCASGAACAFNVTFAPTIAGGQTGSIKLTDTYTGLTSTISLYGIGGYPVVTVTPQSVTFSGTPVGSTYYQTVQVKNTGDAVVYPYLSLNGANASDFALTGSTCTSSLGTNGTCTFTVSFSPKLPGSKSAAVSITGSDPNAQNLPFTLPITATAQ